MNIEEGNVNQEAELRNMMRLAINKTMVLLVPDQKRKDYLIKKYDIPEFIQNQIQVLKLDMEET